MLNRAGLRRLAKEKRLHLFATTRKKRETPEAAAARSIMRQRLDVSKKNTSNFYFSLFQAVYGGKILRQNDMPLFPAEKDQVYSDHTFYPDMIIGGKSKTTYVEIKAVSMNSAKPFFGHRQFAGYCGALLENRGSDMFAAIFKYGNSRPVKSHVCSNEDGHKCDNRCLIEKLSTSTRSLLVIPHNLLTFILVLAHSQEMDHTSSQSTNDFEKYKMPYGTWLTFLHEDYENPSKAIKKILEHADSKYLGLGDFSKDHFYLHDLEVRQYTPRVYCKGRKIGHIIRGKWNPFMVEG